MEETLEMAQAFAMRLNDPAALDRLAGIHSTRALIELHDRLSERINQGTARPDFASEWPGSIASPLFPLPSWLIPLETHEAVNAEGRDMHHCVVMHIPAVIRGDSYLYRVEHPEGRATLSIQRGHSHETPWIIGQLAGVCNRPVKQKVHAAIHEWLDEVQEPDPF